VSCGDGGGGREARRFKSVFGGSREKGCEMGLGGLWMGVEGAY
jgi:hypothetical protein